MSERLRVMVKGNPDQKGYYVGHVPLSEVYSTIYNKPFTPEQVKEKYLLNKRTFYERLTPNKELIELSLKSDERRYNPNMTNPKIILDDGSTVFGMQVWWTVIEEE